MYATLGLLFLSNIFMTFAWYGHLKTLGAKPLWLAVLVSWGIAFFEYCFQVPANRLGSDAGYSLSQLKIIQEVITLLVFCVYAVWRHGEVLRWNHFAAFLFLVLAVVFVFAFHVEQDP